jgi:hypothetical protein
VKTTVKVHSVMYKTGGQMWAIVYSVWLRKSEGSVWWCTNISTIILPQMRKTVITNPRMRQVCCTKKFSGGTCKNLCDLKFVSVWLWIFYYGMGQWRNITSESLGKLQNNVNKWFLEIRKPN